MEIVLGIALIIAVLIIVASIIGRLRRPVRNGEMQPDWQNQSAQPLSTDESSPALNQGNIRRATTPYSQATSPDLAKVQDASDGSLSASLAFSQPDISTEAQDQLQLLLGQGRKIEAIKYYRQTTGVGLKEAKAAVDQLDAGSAFPTPSSLNPAAGNSLIDPDQLQSLLRQGRKIEAIKYYRQTTGVGLKEAKAAVDQLDAGSAFPTPSSLNPAAGNSLIDPDQLQSLLRQGRKIEAIKYYRQTTGVGLKEAKDAVDWLQDNINRES